jgi:hypothetical protein
MKICFDLYDLNKDRKICYSDTFVAIQIRTNNYSDSDLALIKDALFHKKEY